MGLGAPLSLTIKRSQVVQDFAPASEIKISLGVILLPTSTFLSYNPFILRMNPYSGKMVNHYPIINIGYFFYVK